LVLGFLTSSNHRFYLLTAGPIFGVHLTYPQSRPGFLHYSREMEVATAEIKIQQGIAFVVLEKTLWVITNRFSAPWWLPRWISLSVNKKI
jgi:hypothetical protein